MRSSKYSSSEQASRIKELERKLKNEKEKYEELERERDTMKDEYDQDLEEQKDINRQLEQMVMSEEFEKELEDEINQVKELEHANRRFKVKIESKWRYPSLLYIHVRFKFGFLISCFYSLYEKVLEREKGAIAKKYDTKIDEYTNKVTSLEEQLAESDTRAGHLEEKARNTAEEWEAKLADEKSHARDVQNDLEKAQTKMRGMEAELLELRDSCSKIDEYEQVLGKLMERNEELETEVKGAKDEVKVAKDEVDMANRQVELLDRRRAAKIKDLEEKIEEQRVVIEQQQETLDESVKTILKLYSLNNTRGDDLSVMSEEKLTDMARAMVPRLGTNRSSLPPILDEDRGGMISLASGHTSKRPTASSRSMASAGIHSSRGRELTEEVENLMQRKSRSRSTGRAHDRLENFNTSVESLLSNESQFRLSRARSTGRTHERVVNYDEVDSATMESQIVPRSLRARSTGRNHDRLEIYSESDGTTMESEIRPRHMSRGRGGGRTESIRQLTARARTPVLRSRSLSPSTPRPSTSNRSQNEYDPAGPASQSRALVPVMPKESDNPYGGQYDVPPPMRSSSRREPTADRDRGAMYDAPYNESSSNAPRQPTYDKHPLPASRAHRSSHQNNANPQSFGSGPSHRDWREGSERKDSYRPERERDRRERDRGDYRSDPNRDRDSRDRDSRDRDRDRDRDRESDRNRRGGTNDPYYRDGGPQDRSGVFTPRSGGERNSSYQSNSNGVGYVNPNEDAYPSSRRIARDPSLAGNTIISDDGGGRGWRGTSGRHRGRGRPRRDP